MIGRIQGQLVEHTDTQILVDVGGLAYEVEITPAALQHFGTEAGAKVLLYTHFVVREDAQLLYGFISRLERDVFRDLIRISGVGPKLGQNLISAISLEQLAHCVQHNDVAMLTRVPGVGKKTAERLLVELKGRLENFAIPEVMSNAASPVMVGEAEAALEALGYRPAEAQRAIAQARASSGQADIGSEALVRLALKQISRLSEVTR
jgi:Holliday junction DNA helicase RuvA